MNIFCYFIDNYSIQFISCSKMSRTCISPYINIAMMNNLGSLKDSSLIYKIMCFWNSF